MWIATSKFAISIRVYASARSKTHIASVRLFYKTLRLRPLIIYRAQISYLKLSLLLLQSSDIISEAPGVPRRGSRLFLKRSPVASDWGETARANNYDGRPSRARPASRDGGAEIDGDPPSAPRSPGRSGSSKRTPRRIRAPRHRRPVDDLGRSRGEGAISDPTFRCDARGARSAPPRADSERARRV
jgi:hypothetical protein